ncbi:MAG: hypothetical protein AB7P03_30755 [Kofleriaceae bacterium]
MIRPILALLVIALLVTGVAPSSRADEAASFKIIVHPDNPSHSVSRDFLRDAYLKKATQWHGETIRPIDLSTKFVARDRFTQQVLRKTRAQLKNYWTQQIFSGKGVPPPEVSSTADVVEYVVANRGAVGYLPIDADPGRARVIGLR